MRSIRYRLIVNGEGRGSIMTPALVTQCRSHRSPCKVFSPTRRCRRPIWSNPEVATLVVILQAWRFRLVKFIPSGQIGLSSLHAEFRLRPTTKLGGING